MYTERALEKAIIHKIETYGGFVRRIKYRNRDGCPDLIARMRTSDPLYFIELKTADGVLSAAQQDEIDVLARYNLCDPEYSVVRSLAQACELLEIPYDPE